MGSKRNDSPKRRGSPGPGAYDPQSSHTIGQSHRKGQTSAFKSTSERPLGLSKGDATGDPGKYNPHMSYVDPRKKSFGYEQALSASALEKKKKAGKLGKGGTFGGGSAKRVLQMQLLGEMGPGPGSYLPASTFGKFAVSKEAQQQRSRATSSFKSGSAQRQRPLNMHVPGAGAYSPNFTSVEKNKINPGSSLSSKSSRISRNDLDSSQATDSDIGPGAYESHVHNSVARVVAKTVERMSRQNPGFGIAGPAHELPHEQDVEDNQDLPGPGKYNKEKNELDRVNGHTSVFKPPTKRTKAPPEAWDAASAKGGKKGGGAGKGKQKGDATIHV